MCRELTAGREATGGEQTQRGRRARGALALRGGLRVAFALVFCLGLLTETQAAEPAWKVGVARADITPRTSVWLAGYGSKRAPRGCGW